MVRAQSVSLTGRSLATAALLFLIAGPSPAQQSPTPSRIRGTIDSIESEVLNVKSRTGEMIKLHMASDVRVADVVKMSLADIKQGSYVGVAGMPQPDGSQKVLEVLVFPEAMRGTAEGFGPWDLQPNSTMTNAAVSEIVVANVGRTLTLKYKDGEKKIIVSGDTPVVTVEPGQKSELIPGAKVFAIVNGQANGLPDIGRVNVGRDGLMPPM